MPDEESQQSIDVRSYYDANTRRFLKTGHGGSALAIRRAVWGPGVTSRDAAMQYVNDLVADRMQQTGAARVLDLGCGVGGSMLYLSGEARAGHTRELHGITLSPVQAEIAQQVLSRGASTGNTPARHIHCGDYTQESAWPDGPLDLAYAIESSIHVERMDRALKIAGERLRPGGELIICDDVRVEPGELSGTLRPGRKENLLKAFRDGWYAYGLRSRAELVELAADAGFELLDDRDLSDMLELDRPRDVAARAFLALFGWWPWRGPWLSNIYGGNALQVLLKRGELQYRFLVFRRSVPQ